MKLDARPTAENPRLYEALVPLEDKRLFGRKVKLQAKVSNPGAQLWGESVVAPPVGSLDYEGTPRLSDVTVQAVKITDATTSGIVMSPLVEPIFRFLSWKIAPRTSSASILFA